MRRGVGDLVFLELIASYGGRIRSDAIDLALRQFMQRVTSMSEIFVNSLRDVIMKGKLRSVLGGWIQN
jgi:hypothetical protein